MNCYSNNAKVLLTFTLILFNLYSHCQPLFWKKYIEYPISALHLYPKQITTTHDNGTLICYSGPDYNTSTLMASFFKADSVGNVNWAFMQKGLAGSIFEMDDSSIITTSVCSDTILISKVNKNGQLINSKYFVDSLCKWVNCSMWNDSTILMFSTNYFVWITKSLTFSKILAHTPCNYTTGIYLPYLSFPTLSVFPDHSFVLGGELANNDSTSIIKFDSSGNFLWKKNYGFGNGANHLESFQVRTCNNRDIILFGTNTSWPPGPISYFFCTDSMGVPKWKYESDYLKIIDAIPLNTGKIFLSIFDGNYLGAAIFDPDSTNFKAHIYSHVDILYSSRPHFLIDNYIIKKIEQHSYDASMEIFVTDTSFSNLCFIGQNNFTVNSGVIGFVTDSFFTAADSIVATDTIFQLQKGYVVQDICPINYTQSSAAKNKLSVINPVITDILFISDVPPSSDFILSNSNGERILSGKVTENKIELKQIHSGFYYLTIKNKFETHFLKIVKVDLN